jgi:hypothetical protein
VTGAVVAKITFGSFSVATRVGVGLTAKPCAMVQSFIVETRCSDSAVVKSGG